MTTYTMQEGAEGGGGGGKLMFGLGVGRAANVLDSEVWGSGRFADKPYTNVHAAIKGQRLLLQELSRCTDRLCRSGITDRWANYDQCSWPHETLFRKNQS